MNAEESKEIISLREEILGLKEEIFKLNNLVFDIVKELKINVGRKMERERSKEIEDILSNCLDNF